MYTHMYTHTHTPFPAWIMIDSDDTCISDTRVRIGDDSYTYT